MQTTLYGKLKQRRKRGGEWLIGRDTRNIPFSCSNTTQDKIKTRKARINDVKARRHVRRVSLMGKTRRHEGAQFSRL